MKFGSHIVLLGKYYIYIGLAMIAISASVVTYWLSFPEEVLQVRNQPVPVHPSSQKPDQLVFVTVDYCKVTKATGTVRRFLVSDSVRLPLPVVRDNGPVTCQIVEAPVLIPKEASPDTYRISYSVTYKVNPLREVVSEFESKPFTVE